MGFFVRNLELNDFVENTEPLLNPCRGMYCIHKFYVNEDVKPDELKFDVNQKLVLVELNISAYREGLIDEKGLGNIRQLLGIYKDLGLNIILRVLYDFEGEGIKNEPNNICIIIKHMKQLQFIFAEFEELIFVIQGLFIGSWGEMHGTRFREKYQHVMLYNTLAKNSGKSTFLSVRCPNMWRYISDSKIDWMSQDDRLGLFNDGILGSDTDLGTYVENGKTSADGKRDREYEISFQNRLCSFVPNGGEILYSSLSEDKVKAVKTLEDMKITYLNSEHDIRVINLWKNEQAFWIDSRWKDKTLYDYIAEHIGYRFVLRKAVGKYYRLSRRLKYRIELANSGMAPCYQNIDVSVLISGADRDCTVNIGTVSRPMAENDLIIEGSVKLPGGIFKGRGKRDVALILKPQGISDRIVLGNIGEIKDRTNLIGRL